MAGSAGRRNSKSHAEKERVERARRYLQELDLVERGTNGVQAPALGHGKHNAV